MKAACGVALKDRKRALDLMLTLDFSETMDQLTMANSVCWYNHTLKIYPEREVDYGMVLIGLANCNDCPVFKERERPTSCEHLSPYCSYVHHRKLLEILIVNRLSWWLEAKSLLSPWQAGFRKRRCTTDQCLRLSQFVSDGFQSTNKERTVLMLFDYSKVYDTVCRTGLLQKMLDIGIPLRFVQWMTAWLTNRIARVQLNGVTGRCRTFREGLPQGSILSPLLFVLYINDLLGSFSESTMVSAYADDLALACRGRKKEDVALRMQAEVDKVVSWSQQARLTLNAAKC